jgi:hypothetical protein
MIKPGWILDTLIFWVLFATITVAAILARRGKVLRMRWLPALEGIKEGVGRAVEMNQPVHFSPGAGTMLSGDWATQTVAAISILAYVSRLCAKYGARLLVSYPYAEWLPLIEEAYKSGFILEGRSERINPTDLRPYLGGYYVFDVGVMRRLLDEKPATVINVGPIIWDSVDIGETAKRIGAIMIGGTARLLQLPYVVLTSDYVFIGEELYAAGAVASGDPFQINTVGSQDVGKYFVLVMLVLGIILLALGLPINAWLSI